MSLLEKLIGKDVDALQADAEHLEELIHNFLLVKNRPFGESVGVALYAITLFLLKRNQLAGQTATASARVIIELVPAAMKFYVEKINNEVRPS